MDNNLKKIQKEPRLVKSNRTSSTSNGNAAEPNRLMDYMSANVERISAERRKSNGKECAL